MNTSDFTTDLGSDGPVPAGLPSPAVLEQLANRLMRATSPEAAGMPAHPLVPASVPSMVPASAGEAGNMAQVPRVSEATTAARPESAFSFLDQARPLWSADLDPTSLERLASQSLGPISPESVAMPNDRVLPTSLGEAGSLARVPGAPEAITPSSTFGFLEQARPLWSTPPELVGMPQTGGAPIPAAPAPAELDLLNMARSSESFGGVLSLAPVGSTLGAIPRLPLSSIPFDVNAVRRDFPILREQVHGKPLIWLDNAATTQKPQAVIDRLSYFYAHENSNIHRAAHELAARATDAYEAARDKVRRFLNASSSQEIVFVRGATEGINLIAQGWGRRYVQKDDEIVITWLEHHANIVPWQMLCAEKGARLRVAPVDDSGQVLLDEYNKLLGPRTRLVSLPHVSNALGTVTPVQEMVAMAHRHGARVLVDGAQAVSHLQVDVQALDCDFYVFSGHKVFAPTGIGVVYGKPEVLAETPPWQGGGNMIADVTFEKTLYQAPPQRFEAGTGNIADAVGLGAAVDYLGRLGMVNITRYEHELLVYALDAMRRIPGLRLIGTAAEKTSVLSFVLDGYRSEEVGHALNRDGIAVRSGHHCAQPILRRFGVETTVRPSLALYNTFDEIDTMCATLWNLKTGNGSRL